MQQQGFAILDNIPEGIFIIKPDWTVLVWNRCLQDWSGISSSEIIGKPVTQYFPHLKEQRYSDRLESLFHNGPPIIFSSQLHKHVIPCPLKNGDLRVLHTIVTPYKVPGSESSCALFTIQDLTDQTSRIREYNSLHKKLKEEIQQRTKAEIKMVKVKEDAEKANNAKSNFLAQMSHELRTPLNSILGFAQLLQLDSDNPLNEQQIQNLEKVSSAGNHLLELINEVLDLSKIEAGKIQLKIEPVETHKILQEVISLIQPSAKDSEISLNVSNLQQPEIFVEGDYLRVKQILLNLISNAVKFNKPKGSVTVSITPIDENIRVSVEDTGPGISPDNLSRLFTPFERLRVEDTQVEGTGIGLTISKKLAQAMKGDIEVVSTLGTGSTFSLMLPAAIKPQVGAPAKEVHSISVEQQSTGVKKILYIEDIITNIELVRQVLLRRPNYKFSYSLHAVKGIEMALDEPPDLILMDIHLPEMDGLTAFEKLAEKPETKSIPVIALTADAMGPDIQKALDMGFHDYVTKPINIDKFLTILDKILA